MKKWAVFHGLVATAFLISLFVSKGHIKIDADFLNMIPKSFSTKDFSNADSILTENTNRAVVILSKNADFEKARRDAEKLYLELEKSGKFESISFYSDDDVSKIFDFLSENKYNLADLKNAEPSEIAQSALYKAFSPFTLAPLDLENDPFLLTESAMENYISAISKTGSKMSVKDGVLASEIDDFWYVMIRGVLKKEATALASKDNAVVFIKKAISDISTAPGDSSATGDPTGDSSATNNSDFIFSGTPFHSHASSTSATREITLITTISILAVVFMLLFVFRSPLPIFVTVLTIGVSILSGFLATLAVFRTIHVLVLVFATSLIGSCIDYSLHFFVNWKGNADLKTGTEIKNRIFKGLSLSFASTVLCYSVLFFAPYNLLKQMAVFSISGFVSTFLTVLCVYPKLPIPSEEKRTLPELKIRRRIPRTAQAAHPHSPIVRSTNAVFLLFTFAILALAVFHKNAKIKNDISSLYTMKGKLLSDENEAGKAIGMKLPSYFLVKGKTENEVLKTLEALETELKKSDEGISILSAASFVPSLEKQKSSKGKIEKLLELSPAQLKTLGFDEKTALSTSKKIKTDFENKKSAFVTMENIPDFLKNATSSLWLGKIDGNFYAVAIPTENPTELPKILENPIAAHDMTADFSNVLFVNKVHDISEDLNRLTRLIFKFFALSFVVIFFTLLFVYKNLKKTLKIISVPLLVILMTTAIFAILKTDLEFFSITGMILVLGMGIDYIIYTVESESHEKSFLERYAITLSVLTTELSFGILALSSFKPVHLIGMAIFIGLATAFILAIIWTPLRKRNNAEGSPSGSETR